MCRRKTRKAVEKTYIYTFLSLLIINLMKSSVFYSDY